MHAPVETEQVLLAAEVRPVGKVIVRRVFAIRKLEAMANGLAIVKVN